MWKYIKKIFLSKKAIPIKIPATYSIKIANNTDKISYVDKKFIEILLNFSPNYNSLKCEINRWDNYIKYMENIRAFIHCEASTHNWNRLGNDLIELNKYIESERKRDIEDFRFFLNLIEVEEEEYNILTDSELVEKTIFFINDYRRDYQNTCSDLSKVYISLGSSVNGYTIIWGKENSFNLILESHG